VNTVRITPATEKDLPAISKLAPEIWHACYRKIITPEQIEYMLKKMYSLETLRAELKSGFRFELLFADEKLLGFASFGQTEVPEVFKLHKLYLQPELQGRGLGSRLLKHCETEARNLGARQMVLNVNKRNTQAMAVYERNAYHIADSVVLGIGNGFVMDDYIMAKSLV
jgi:ribosomal protein S18 acetylase RimI-like enzyme